MQQAPFQERVRSKILHRSCVAGCGPLSWQLMELNSSLSSTRPAAKHLDSTCALGSCNVCCWDTFGPSASHFGLPCRYEPLPENVYRRVANWMHLSTPCVECCRLSSTVNIIFLWTVCNTYCERTTFLRGEKTVANTQQKLQWSGAEWLFSIRVSKCEFGNWATYKFLPKIVFFFFFLSIFRISRTCTAYTITTWARKSSFTKRGFISIWKWFGFAASDNEQNRNKKKCRNKLFQCLCFVLRFSNSFYFNGLLLPFLSPQIEKRFQALQVAYFASISL